jgi:hypothetical protein
MTQHSLLFDAAAAREATYPHAPPHRGEPSQIDGAKKIRTRVPRIKKRCLDAIDELGGATIEEMAKHTGLKVSTVCGRVGELRILGTIIAADFTRKAASGVHVKVWIRTPTGRG